MARTYIEYGRVIGWLRRDVIAVSLRYATLPQFGKPPDFFEELAELPADLFPYELRCPNAEIWVVTEYLDDDLRECTVRILARDGFDYPHEYHHLRKQKS